MKFIKIDKIEKDSKEEVYNLECYPNENYFTNNILVHNCSMCPRTTMMTRPIGTMSLPLFKKIIDQLKPWSKSEWENWVSFVIENYHVEPNEMSENHFFFYIVPKVITLHGYGEPLLDKHIVDRISYLFQHKIPSYFSCNPNNITFEKGIQLMEHGIDYLKLSSDNIRLFEKSENTIKKLLDHNSNLGKYKTNFIIDIVGNKEDYEKLQKMFSGYDVYMYFKSQDNRWYKQSTAGQQSTHWLEPCQFPWSSMSIMWDGSVVPCSQDFNNEIVLGNANNQSLKEIWRNLSYSKLRNTHLLKNKNIKCIGRCDLKLVGDF